jgi:hypothetical protein
MRAIGHPFHVRNAREYCGSLEKIGLWISPPYRLAMANREKGQGLTASDTVSEEETRQKRILGFELQLLFSNNYILGLGGGESIDPNFFFSLFGRRLGQ